MADVRYSADGRPIFEPDGATLAAFLLDRSEIAIIRGPWGSGTSSACCQRIWQHIMEQRVGSDGYQRSRWFVMRESYPKLETTTLETWKYWFPERVYGKLFTGSKPYRQEIRLGRLWADVYFGAVDDLQGDSIFVSLEPTGWWWNELEYVSRDMLFSGHGRVGRFPPVRDGGSAWSGTIADLNAPPENHWLPMMTGEVELPDDMPLDEKLAYQRPPGMAYFVQPPAVLPMKDAGGRMVGFRVNPGAENLKWLRDTRAGQAEEISGQRYYERAMRGKTSRWIRKNLGNEILPMVEGEAVWPTFDADYHATKQPLEPVEGLDLYVGLDFGRRPAAVFAQRVGGQWQIQMEAGIENGSAARFAPEVRKIIAAHYPWVMNPHHGAAMHVYGDPKGRDGQQNDESTAYDVFRSVGITVLPAPVKQNNIQTRIDTVEWALDRNAGGGRPYLLIGPRCRRLRMAMVGGYRFPKERPTPMADRKPVKDKFSDHPDALGYLLIGGGEIHAMKGREVMGIGSKPVVTRAPRGSRRRLAGRALRATV